MEKEKNRSLAKKVVVAGSLLLGSFALAGCEVAPPAALANVLDMGWPDPITPEGVQMYNFWVWVWVAAWTIGIIMWVLFLVAIFKWNAKAQAKKTDDEFPKQLQYNVPLELGLTILPIIIVFVLFFFTVQAQTKAVALDKDPEVTVDVTAFQWNWKFGYSQIGADLSPTGQLYNGVDEARQALAEDTKFDAEDMPNANPIHGTSTGDMSYLNYNVIETTGTTDEVPVLVLPTETPIEFRLASGDVSHAFWVPEFLFKRDVYAHPESNQQQRSFQIERIDREGAFVGRCAEMCGTYHAMMNFEVRAVSPEDFRAYIQFRNDNPDASNAQALESIGQDPYATTTRPFNSDRTGTRDGQNYTDPNQNV
ncbi:aa3-type cytochrome oxidase subunit II [Corynebacterium sanguinis]|uniref:aa3-type cytochrome oxidase subunit II n=1 Tax=Corynebacterium sanguinis TaxID=2594913 RepID=UPI00223BD3B4|nr:cytochrome c oxidase subunit II [Corynebacterium sanguinis]MCT1613098.1 cytochrome c oxidase subunit II [Corynebacterium sanguinis]MCT1804476.1 cytochrome c oxidase subunit II [Corynebacterium sanguinis]MCT1881795.1 cytochrome c oxidase subunit II [Corynebacterium sanguinis]MCT2157703.1 cytochrome c oxidase subunit II [Corynebacterium sanguinis]MCT2287113.1 cytochrome c oxidase subunit II [Corynebacterium sanguinis]